MKFSLSWLKTHLDYEAPLDDLVIALTNIGIEVEAVEDQSKVLAPFVIAKILETKKHPNADKLQICVVDNGQEKVELVCGDPAARKDMITVFAPVGTYIPGLDITLKKAKIRDVESNGMLCSAKELGLEKDSSGIMDLTSGTPGEPLVKAFNLGDPVIQVSITPNRPDWLGVRGIARDLAASGFGTLKQDQRTQQLKVTGKETKKVSFNFKEGRPCRTFTARLIKNVKNGPSPEWLQRRLTSIGLRPISALVDITNFLTFDICRPLHVFDLDKLKGDLTLGDAIGGEELLALDKNTYVLQEGMSVIKDDSGVISLAGIIGGESTAVDEGTTNVLLECADFDPIRIAKTGRLLNLNSDARYRFERGVDPLSTVEGNALGAALIQEICGGEIHEVTCTGEPLQRDVHITLPLARIQELTGVDVPHDKAEDFLKKLGCEVKHTSEMLNVIPPSWRGDLEGPADLIEEILRLHGYNTIPETDLSLDQTRQPLSRSLLNRALARQTFIDRGFDEVISYSFMELDKAKLFGGGQEELQLENPISVELSTMRPSLLPNLLDAAARNIARGQSDLSLFEVGATYHTDEPEGQFNNAAGIRVGKAGPKHWAEVSRPWDIYDIKADVIAFCTHYGFKEDQMWLKAEAPLWYHPGRSGSFTFGGKNLVAVFGEMHPRLKKTFGIEASVMMCEIYVETLPESPRRKITALHLSPYQAVTRDFAFLFDETTQVAHVIKTIKSLDKDLVQHVEIFDLYQGDKLKKGQKSVAFSVKLQAMDRTLSEVEIEAFSQNVIKSVQDKTGGVLRDF